MPDRRRWVILAVGTFAQAATSCFLYGVPLLIPAFQNEGASLFGASLLVSAPIVGLLLTLILWGALADRYGERIVILAGVGTCAALLACAPIVPGLAGLGAVLVLAGFFGASVNAASGRVVMGWFPQHERGLAMGTRQTAQPVGVALAALGLPALAHHVGVHRAMLYPAGLCALATVLVLFLVVDPPRPPKDNTHVAAPSPYRGSVHLLRVHVSSALLVVPQFAVATFTLVYLVGQRNWDPVVAGRLIFGFQVAGAIGRVVTGIWSDRVGSRLRPMRQLAVASAGLMAMIALGAATQLWFVVLGFAVGAVVTVADNGLAYVSVAELAGSEWAGRALGAQNTGQNLAAVGTAPMLAAIVGGSHYGIGFVIVALFPLAAIALIPVRAEARLPSRFGDSVATEPA